MATASATAHPRDLSPMGILRACHLTFSGATLLLLAATGWLLARLIGSRVLFIIVYGGVLVMGAAFLVARRRLALAVERSALPTRVREGQQIQVSLQVRAGRRASTLILEERMPEALGKTVRIPVASVGAGETFEHEYVFQARRRGVYQVGPTVASWSDPFGLTTQEQQLAKASPLVVHPSTEAVSDRVLTRMWEDPPTRPPVSKPWPTGFEFYGMRDYVPGDDLRRVVWTAVAKTGRMLVRESEQGITDQVVVLLDTYREWHSPGPVSDTFELGVKVAASLGVRHLKDGFAVTYLSNGRKAPVRLRGGRANITLLDELARVEMTSTPLSDAVQLMLSQARGAHYALITPHIDKQSTDRIRLLLDRGSSVVVVKLVWEGSEPASLSRAAALGCVVVQVPLHASIDTAFSHQIGGGVRR
jgi:uncharacterized protein (DUF58 family)